MNCQHWRDCGRSTGGACAEGVRQHPSYHFCEHRCTRRLPYPDGIVPVPPPRAARTEPPPPPKWPWPARIVRRLRTDEDKGVGDTLERLIRHVGGDWFKWAMESLGIPCGCTDRQAWLNSTYRY